MNRRMLLLAVGNLGTAGLAGCLGRGDSDETDEETVPTADIPLRVAGVFPKTHDQELYSNSSFIALRKETDETVSLEGVTVEYISNRLTGQGFKTNYEPDYTYTFKDLQLDSPGVFLVSDEGEGGQWHASGWYERHAGIAPDESPIGQRGTIVVKDPDDAFVTQVRYEAGACAGGSAVDEDGNELSCPD